MSKVRQHNGEDPPEAAAKLLDDAYTLFASSRWDSACYLAGYVAECALKAVILVGNAGRPDWPRGAQGHDLGQLGAKASSWLGSAVFNGRTATYQRTLQPNSCLGRWEVALRYHPPHLTVQDAEGFLGEAESLYCATVVEMHKDGLL